VEDRFEKKLSSWIGKMLSYGDRLVLIKSVLTSLPMFMEIAAAPKQIRGTSRTNWCSMEVPMRNIGRIQE
jgi:hypothetical protein